MTTTVYYPSQLPAPLRAGKQRRQAPSFRVTDSYRGRAYAQPIGTDTPVFWDLTFRFTQAQAQLFIFWFEYSIERGAAPFVMRIRTEFGLVLHELQFLPDGLLDMSEDGPLFTYQAKVMARKAVIPQEYENLKDSILDGLFVLGSGPGAQDGISLSEFNIGI